jgi:hypothetical protein
MESHPAKNVSPIVLHSWKMVMSDDGIRYAYSDPADSTMPVKNNVLDKMGASDLESLLSFIFCIGTIHL